MQATLVIGCTCGQCLKPTLDKLTKGLRVVYSSDFVKDIVKSKDQDFYYIPHNKQQEEMVTTDVEAIIYNDVSFPRDVEKIEALMRADKIYIQSWTGFRYYAITPVLYFTTNNSPSEISKAFGGKIVSMQYDAMKVAAGIVNDIFNKVMSAEKKEETVNGKLNKEGLEESFKRHKEIVEKLRQNPPVVPFPSGGIVSNNPSSPKNPKPPSTDLDELISLVRINNLLYGEQWAKVMQGEITYEVWRKNARENRNRLEYMVMKYDAGQTMETAVR